MSWNCWRGVSCEHEGVGLVERRFDLVVAGIGVEAVLETGLEDGSAQPAAHERVHDRRQCLRVLQEPRVRGALHDDEVAASPASSVLRGGKGDGDVAVAVDGEHRDLLVAQRVEHPASALAAKDRRRRREEAPRPPHVPRERGAHEAAELHGLLGVAEPRNGRGRVDHEGDADPDEQRGEDAEQGDHAVPGVADDGVEQDHGDGPMGLAWRPAR